MAKLLIIGFLCLVALQATFAKDLTETLNSNIREQLKGYQLFLEQDDGTYKAELTKLIELTEGALNADTVDEKQAILDGLGEHFSPEFNKFISARLEAYQVNDDIRDSIEFYRSLLTGDTKFESEIQKVVDTLEELLKLTDLKEKEERYLALEKTFTPEFKDFLKNNQLPVVNRALQNNVEFFENLLIEPEPKYEAEIKELKAQAEAALGDISVEEKQAALQKITNPTDPVLYKYLQKRYIELN